jgi:RecB family endonuclease NucS
MKLRLQVGVEYPTAAGPIDTLAVGAKGALYAIELKVSRGPDAAPRQVLRYMGSIRRSIVFGNPVYGVIVAATMRDKLRIALSEIKEKVCAMGYEFKMVLQPLQ